MRFNLCTYTVHSCMLPRRNPQAAQQGSGQQGRRRRVLVLAAASAAAAVVWALLRPQQAREHASRAWSTVAGAVSHLEVSHSAGARDGVVVTLPLLRSPIFKRRGRRAEAQ